MLFGLSMAVGIGLLEGVCRLQFEAVDYLKPRLQQHAILGHFIEGHTGGHDRLGFRNRFVPDHAEIVAIGDSQTYGEAAIASYSWPAQLGRMSGLSTYNMSLGGYAVPQYYYLLEKYALKLSPKTIVVGFYFGNDLLLSSRMVKMRKQPYWRFLSIPPAKAGAHVEDIEVLQMNSNSHRPFHALRAWLAGHSILYRLITHSVIGTMARMMEWSVSEPSDLIELADREKGTSTYLEVDYRLKALNRDDPAVIESLHLSIALFERMQQLCSKNGVRLIIALIPTKERVYAEIIAKNRNLKTNEMIWHLLRDERKISDCLKAALARLGIEYVDTEPALRRATRTSTLYPARDGHPSKDGYRVIAETVLSQIRSNSIKPLR